jgi:hypothetical protein
MKEYHPSSIPVEKWPQGWLKLECASILTPTFLIMHDHEKKAKGYPVTREEMIILIKSSPKR